MNSGPCKASEMDYGKAHGDALRRLRRGERQVYCGVCKLWRWRHEVGILHSTHTLSIREFKAASRKTKPATSPPSNATA